MFGSGIPHFKENGVLFGPYMFDINTCTFSEVHRDTALLKFG